MSSVSSAPGRMFDRPAPHSAEAEMALLGSILLDPKRLAEVQAVLAGGDDFYVERHAAIYGAIVAVFDRFATQDLVVLTDKLRDDGRLDQVGGPAYLIELAEGVPSPVNAVHYARVVADKAQLRRLIEVAGQAMYEAYHSGELGAEGVREVMDRAQAAILHATRSGRNSGSSSMAELMDATLAAIEANEGKGPRGLITGFHDLDDLTGGLQRGEMTVVAARPSMGKTALMLCLAEQIATGGAAAGATRTRPETPVALFSLEMTSASISERMICSRARVSSRALRTGRALVKDEYKRLIHACGELRGVPIHVDSTVSSTVNAVRARARQLVAEKNVGCIMVDYLQLMRDPSSSENRQTEVASISRGLKDLARELNVPVVVLAQLNRLAENRADNRPRMSDIRESGSIEQDADNIALLHREEYYHQGDEEWRHKHADKIGVAELIVAKQRSGPTGVVKLLWDAEFTRFKSMDLHAQQAAAAGPLFDVGGLPT